MYIYISMDRPSPLSIAREKKLLLIIDKHPVYISH